MIIATIDTGTTNTRVKIWRKGGVVTSSNVGVGVRDTSITGSTDKLKQGVGEAVKRALDKAQLAHEDIGLYLASGMITSNVGLHEVPHVQAPAGVAELADHMVSATIEGVVDQPIWFVPGVKNELADITLRNIEAMDIMRGEEVETFGLLDHLSQTGSVLLILPGSHTKFIRVDQHGRISGCVTTMAGELLSVLTTDTILASSLGKSFTETIHREMILRGSECSRQQGLTRACFAVRLLDLFSDSSLDERANFLTGVIVATDLLAVKSGSTLGDCSELTVIIGGSNALAGVFEVLVSEDDYFRGDIIMVDGKAMMDTSGSGAIMAARARGLCS